MKNILELVNLLDQNKHATLPVVNVPYQKDDLYTKFYQEVVAGNINSDEDAARILYGETPSSQKYKQLKHRFKGRLNDSVLLINHDTKEHIEGQKAYYTCHKNLAIVNILMSKGAKQTALDIGNKTLKIAMKFEFIDISTNIIEVLRRLYVIHKVDKKKFNSLNKLYHKQKLNQTAETEAEELFLRLSINLINSKDYKKEYSQKAKEFSQKLSIYINSVETHRFLFFSKLIELIPHEINNEYEKAIEISLETYNKLLTKPFKLKIIKFVFVFKAFYGYINLCNYLGAKKLIPKCLESLDYASLNWFKFNQVKFVYLMRIKKYRKANELLIETSTNKRFPFLDNNTLEIWKIYIAYLHLTINNKKDTQKSNKVFSIGKFLNEVPIYSKDKRGLNIQILIVQILLLLQRKKYNAIIDKIPSLERYSSRYLKSHNAYRANCFIKMLLQLEKGNFHPVGVQRHAKKYLAKLHEVPLEKSTAVLEMEIVPFDQLWEMAIEMLEDYQ